MRHREVQSGSLLWIVIAVVTALSCGGASEDAPPDATVSDDAPAPAVDLAVRSHSEVDVRWEREWEAAFDRARSENKPVLVNFTAEWCVWCKHLETVTFADSKVGAMLAGRVVPLNIDIDAASPELLRSQRIEAPPTIVLLGFDGQELGRIAGYMPPTGFLKTVERILGTAQS